MYGQGVPLEHLVLRLSAFNHLDVDSVEVFPVTCRAL